MNQDRAIGYYKRIGCAFGLLWVIASPSALGQVVPDRTLGAESSRVAQGVTVRGRTGDRIDGGATRGSNLFHSFSEFNVGDGDRVYFANPNGIENIISRVTGNDVSDILGTLGVDGGANLYLLNPNGIIFGANAQLDVRGAFVASTADGLAFADGRLFNARETQTSPLLSIAVPVGLQYGAIQPGAISNAGNLAVAPGQTLSLVGGTVTNTGQLVAPGGTIQVLGDRVALLAGSRIDVSSETGGGTVLIGGDSQGSGAVLTADRTLIARGATISADALISGNGGRVIVWADEVTGFYGNISARGGSNSGNGGFVEVSGRQNLFFDGNADLTAPAGLWGTLLLDPTNVTLTNSPSTPGVDGSLPDIFAGDFSGTDSTINAATLAAQPATVIVQADDDIRIASGTSLSFVPGGSIEFTADFNGNRTGSFRMDSDQSIATNGRSIEISGASLSLGNINTSSRNTDGGSIMLTATGDSINVNSLISGSSARDSNGNVVGNGGAITLDAVNDINSGVINTVGITSNVEPIGGGVNGADVNITSSRGNINLSGLIGPADSSVIGRSITINTSGTLSVVGALNARSDTSRDAGNIRIGNLSSPSSIAVGALSARNLPNLPSGSGGNIEVITTGSFVASGARVRGTGFTIGNTQLVNEGFSIGSEARSNGGRISVQASEITTRAGIVSNSRGVGNGGNISLRASNGGITIQAGTLDSSANLGNGGAIDLDATGNIRVAGDVLSNSDVAGNGGNVTFTSRSGRIDTTAGTINASSAIGNGGDVTLRTPGNISPGSILTGGFLGGVGGEINLDSGGTLFINNADIASITGGSGRGGNIEFSANSLRLDRARVGAITAIGRGGDINIDANSVQLNDAIIGSVTGLGNGRGGDIQIMNADTIRIRNSIVRSVPDDPLFERLPIPLSNDVLQRIRTGSGLATTTTAAGQAGDISIDTNRLNISAEAGADGQTGISTLALTGSSNRSGNLTINAAESVRITGNDQREQFNPQPNIDTAEQVNGIQTGITSATLGSGHAGDLEITTDRLTLQNGAAVTSGNGVAGTAGTGNGGNLTINASEFVDLQGFAALATVTFSQGEAGNLTVNSDRIRLSQGALFAADTLGRGRAGSIQVTTDNLQILTGSRIGAATRGFGRGGEITIGTEGDRADRVDIIGTSTTVPSGIFTDSQGERRAGNINIYANQFNVEDQAQVSVSSSGTGAAGNLTVEARDIFLAQQASLRGTTNLALSGANLFITADRDIELRNDGGAIETEITTQADEDSNGGRISVTAGRRIFSTFSQNSDIVADADRGQGGFVIADAPLITGFRQYEGTRTPESDFVAGSRQGNPGDVVVQDNPPQNPLPAEPDLPQIDRVCPSAQGLTTRAAGTSQFLNTGRGGLPPNPTGAIDSNAVQVPWVTVPSEENRLDQSSAEPPPAVIEEAQGWQRLPNGEFLFTATATAPLPCVSSSQ